MNCPHCTLRATTQLAKKTSLGYKVFRCVSALASSTSALALPSTAYSSQQTPSC